MLKSSSKLSIIRCGAVITGMVLTSGAADSQILNTNNIEQFCKAPAVTHRRTLVYVDVSTIAKGKNEWGLTLINRLELGTRETLTLLSVNPNSFEINQVFELCYPTFTKGEIDNVRAGRSTWDKLTSSDPEEQQRENLQTFDARLKNALDKVLSDSSKYQPGKRKNILGAIAFDKNRFVDRSALYRVIVHTDGALQDPDIDAAGDASRQVSALSAKYPASFFGAEISVFGVAEGGDGSSTLQTKERIFSAFFLSNWAHLKSFSSALPRQRSDVFPAVTRLEGSFEGGGSQGAAKLAYSSPNAGTEGWITFVVGRNQLFLPFEGTFQCEGEQCKLSGNASESVPPLAASPFFRKGDRILLQGKRSAGLEGALSSEAREVFKDANQEAKYLLKFQKP